MTSSLIIAQDLNKTYHEDSLNVVAITDVDLVLPPAALAVIMGPSGGGKSTLLHVLGGLTRVDSGSLEVAQVNLSKANEATLNQFRREKIGFIFQSYNLLPSFSAIDNVCLPLLARGESQKNARIKAMSALDRVGLSKRVKHRPGQLSGGEQQRVAIARALVVKPQLDLADEPTGNLDSAAAREIIDLFIDLNQTNGISFIVATHNIEIRSISTHSFEMHDGYLAPL